MTVSMRKMTSSQFGMKVPRCMAVELPLDGRQSSCRCRNCVDLSARRKVAAELPHSEGLLRNHVLLSVLGLLLVAMMSARADTVLVEAESFSEHGGWMLDTQFIEIVGSPYLIAHGMGRPVEDAVTAVRISEAGKYRIWVRTKQWTGPWNTEQAPGKFQVSVAGKPLEKVFGAEGAEWFWEDGGEVELPAGDVELGLHDLTGFDGRCDAIVFSNEPGFVPDNTSEVLPAWRLALLGLPAEPVDAGDFDLVVVGGGYAGTGAAISAARMGLRVALVQNREVLGGNGSSEVRVWAKGNTPSGLYPVGDIIRELEDHASASPAPYAEWEDDKKERIVRDEKLISLFLGHHAFRVVKDGEDRIAAVQALDVRTSEVREFRAPFFVDSTGHGFIGMWAGADREMIPGGRMGMSNMWMWRLTEEEKDFPETPWALDLAEGDFPYPTRFHAQWFWESGFDKHPLEDLEEIRDWNLRAAYGAWNAIKNKGAYADYDETGEGHAKAELQWLAYIGGPRETQQLLGDIILSEPDILEGRSWPDAAVLSTWSIDLHYPKKEYLAAYPDNPFISIAEHGKGVDRKKGYPVPYRCFYSRNIGNLFMAGRNISVTHKALGTVRVMKTCGMMGVVVGKAAAIAVKRDSTPRGVYEDHLDELISLMKLPGRMRRDSLEGPFYEDESLPRLTPPEFEFMDPADLAGIVIDDDQAVLKGNWKGGEGLKGYIGDQYRYAAKDSGAEARYPFTVKETGRYEVRMSYQPHENRGSATPVTVEGAREGAATVRVNQQVKAPLEHGFISLGEFTFERGKAAAVVIGTADAGGSAHADAVQVVKIE